MVDFLKYPSLTNHYRQKEIDWWLEREPSLDYARFIATEKIHGSNVSLIFSPNEEMQIASRNRILESDDNFYGILDVINDLQAFVSYMSELADTHQTIYRVYGEIFGPGINKGVDYGDHRRILFFDVSVEENGLSPRLLSYYYFLRFMNDAGFMGLTMPVVYNVKGLQAALDYDDYDRLTIVGNQSNVMEGVVIKPAHGTYRSPKGSVFIIKKKHAEFEERKSEKKVKVVDEVVESANQIFRGYVNDMRVQSVFSKEGMIESPKEIGTYIRLVLQDAKEDFLMDNDISGLDKGQQRQVFNVGSVIANLLKGYL